MLIAVLVAAGVVALLILLLSVYVVCRYSAEEEDGDAWLPRALVVLSLTVACYMVLLLPLEMAVHAERADVSLAWAWKVLLAVAYFLLFVGGPYAFVFYESWSPHQSSMWAQVRPAVGVVVAVNAVFLLSFCVLWKLGDHLIGEDSGHTHVMPFDYFVATASIFGWAVFFIFAGVGLAAVPVQGVLAFIHRPRPITRPEYELTKAKLAVEVQHLLSRGRQLDAEMGGRRPSQRQRQRMLLFKREVREVELRSERNDVAFHISGAVILRFYLLMVWSVLNGVVSLLWVLHLLLLEVLSVFPLMDYVLTRLYQLLPMLALFVYTYFALYLMWCTLVGCSTVSGSFLVAVVYPLRVRGTMLNALLFNALLVLCASFAVLQLCVTSFWQYTAETTVSHIFNVAMSDIFIVAYISHHLQYGLLIVFALSIPWLLFCPRFTSGVSHDDDEEDALV